MADSLIAGRSVQHAYLGVSIGTNMNGTGAVIGAVRAGSPAAEAGVKSGDVVVAINGTQVSAANELTAAIAARRRSRPSTPPTATATSSP